MAGCAPVAASRARSSTTNAHLSQIERGSIRRPDPAILMDLAELYDLNYRLIAEWARGRDLGFANPRSPVTAITTTHYHPAPSQPCTRRARPGRPAAPARQAAPAPMMILAPAWPIA